MTCQYVKDFDNETIYISISIDSIDLAFITCLSVHCHWVCLFVFCLDEQHDVLKVVFDDDFVGYLMYVLHHTVH